jgi:hypothetical protein
MNLNPPPPSLEEFKKSATAETPAPSYTPFQTSFASISLHRTDRIRLLQFPQSDIVAIRAVIKRSWIKGIQNEGTYSSSYEFKLFGNPWNGQGNEAITSRIVLREVFAYLYSVGWILHASTDVSKKEFDKDTLIFRKQQHPPPESNWISISFNETDKLRLIGAAKELIAAFGVLLKNMRLLQGEYWKDQRNNAWEFKINGRPWRAFGEETVTTRLLVLKLLETLEKQGWSLYLSVDQSNGHGNQTSETDSWFCVRDKQWIQGSAVFHR